MVTFVKTLLMNYRNKKPLSAMLQLAFLKRLYRLLTRGYSLSEALDVISWDKRLTLIGEKINQSLYQGKYLDEALTEANFNPLIIIYIYFVRINGDLITSLEKSIEMFEQRITAFEKFKKVSRYPLFLISIFVVLLFLIQQFILPAYSEMFQFHAESAATVQLTFFMFNLSFTIFIVLIMISLIMTIIWHINKQKLSIEKQLEILNYIPVLRNYVRLQTSFYFATHVSLFLKTGMSLKSIIQHLETQEELPIIKYYASIMGNHLSRGYYLDDLLVSLPFIDQQLANIFQQQSDIENLEKDLATYADFVAEYIEENIMKSIMYIQPVTFSLLGIFIVVIYISLLWPMFQLIDAI